MYGPKIPDTSGKLYFEDNDKSPQSGIASAILILILGCSLVLAFFVYLLLTTRFVGKKIKWVGNLQGQKNVDVDGDYLINGMYL